MRKYAILFSLLIAVSMPFAASALSFSDLRFRVQEFVLDLVPTQTAPPSFQTMPEMRHRICEMPLARSLKLGSRGADVQALQEFLASEGQLSARATGYFGLLTKSALASYQANAGIPALGLFGPRTREHLKSRCGGGFACTMEYAPVCAQPFGCAVQPDGTELCAKPQPKTYGNRCMANADGATVLYEGECRGSGMNRPPALSALSGPTMLSTNEVGSWRVSASDPENGQLTYSIVWGDEWVRDEMPRPLSSPSESIMQESSFTHSYSRPGTYRIQLTVEDNAGQIAQGSITVNVRNAVCTGEHKPVCGRPPGCANSCPPGAYCPMICRLYDPVTYSNTCELNNANAEYLHEGQCK